MGRGRARPDGDGTLWRAIPEDRDWAFVRVDGLLPWLGRFAMPKYVDFSPRFPDVERLAHSGYRIDHRVMNGLTRDDFLEAARDVQAAITDSVIERAIGVLPEAYRNLEGENLTRALMARRADLRTYALAFYDAFIRSIHVYGHEGVVDVVEFEPLDEERAKVRVVSGGIVRFERVVDGRRTKRVRLFLDPDDRVEGAEDLPFDVERLDVEWEDGEESDEDDADETESGPQDGSDRDY